MIFKEKNVLPFMNLECNSVWETQYVAKNNFHLRDFIMFNMTCNNINCIIVASFNIILLLSILVCVCH